MQMQKIAGNRYQSYLSVMKAL